MHNISTENYLELNKFITLTPEQNKLLGEINDILYKEVDSEQWQKKESQIINFGEKLKKDGIDPLKYLLWHVAIKSTPWDKVDFDLPNHDIERFIKSLEK